MTAGIVEGKRMNIPDVSHQTNLIHSLKEEYGQSLVIAHRGYARNQDFDRNTISAFKYAIEKNTHGIEFDLRLTKDKKVVVSHDPFLRSGLKLKRITTSTYDELVSFTGSRDIIPQFSDVYSLVHKDMPVFVQIKKSSTFTTIMDTIISIIGDNSNVIVMGYRAGVLDNQLHDDFLYGKHYVLPTKSNLEYILDKNDEDRKIQFASPYYRTLTSSHLDLIHRLNLQSVIYTINNTNHIQHYLNRKVDVIYTDNLEDALQLSPQ